MSRHASVEQLSVYLDEELAESQRRRVEEHLRQCAECRRRFEGLQRVVGRLERLERAAPPPHLSQEVGHRVRLERGGGGLFERLERRLGGLIQQPASVPVFALVVTLAAIVYLFSYGLDRAQRGVPVVFDLPAAQEAPADDTEDGGGEAELLSAPAERAAPAALDQAPAERRVGARVFERVEDLWLERGVGPEEPFVALEADSAEAADWLRRHPEIGDLEALEGPVRLRLGSEVVEIGGGAQR